MTFSFNDAYRVINNVVSEKVGQMIKSGAGVEIGWGTIASSDGNKMYSVYLYGDTIASAGFRAENGQVFQLGQPVRVSIDRRGNRWIDSNLSSNAGSVSNIDTPSVTEPGTSYPVGLSYFPATVAGGWPLDVSFVKTYKYGDFRVHQEITRHITMEKYERYYHGSSGWDAWRQVSHRLRFVPITETTLYGSATDSSGTLGEVSKTVEATALPSNLANMYVVGRIMSKHSAAPASVGHYVRVNHWTGGTMAGIAYATNATQWTASYYIAKSGGTNGRQLAVLVYPGGTGTLTFHVTATGYFTDDS